MTLWLVDASVVVAAEDHNDAHHGAAQRLLRGADPIATLDLAMYESANAAVAKRWSDDDTARVVERMRAIGDEGGVVRCSHSVIERAVRLAREHGISVYDAAYVVAADISDAELVSCDVRDLVSRGLAVLPGDAGSEETDT